MRASLSLVEPLGEASTVIGNPVPGAGWYGPNSGLHSVSIKVLNFRGRISIQASLSASPESNDWFSVLPDSLPYWEYPRSGTTIVGGMGETSIAGFNFIANIVWVRVIVDRTYLMPSTALNQGGYLGTVDSILLNY